MEPSWSCWINTAIQYSYMNIYTLIGSVHSSFQWPAKTRPQEANAEFAAWKLWVGVNCTWLYIGSQDAWAVFIIYLFFRSSFPFTPTDVTSIACLFKIVLINVVLYSKYGSVRLGPEGSTPEYNDASWYFLFDRSYLLKMDVQKDMTLWLSQVFNALRLWCQHWSVLLWSGRACLPLHRY